ncbi:TonB-dependent receptor [Algoriphagus sp. A40]|uniref:TonB-dependent receptor n=1 Tax=Algoriphagus sp. A40 TaxID=1945863 RepID=UPI000986A32B|nr:TonB-dependent receptor [Algoriphagus sp. A40]OOG78257.1 TonB-dependent receptor [Algoriphagus sp. A40]
MKYYILFLILISGISKGMAQTYSLQGNVLESDSQQAIPYANILLLSQSDSAQVKGVISDIDGNFEINSVKQGSYILKVQYLGYQEFFKTIQIQSNMALGTIHLKEVATDLNEVVVAAQRSRGEQRNDTTMYNADAFKTMKDASAQKLIEKLPGVTSQDGSLQAQGETITQILVDGKPFFGSDVKTALQNLPAEVIDKIEIYDQKSEKAQLSGFDDGQRLKTINIVTKQNRRKGQFGKTTVGYGTDERYIAGASINLFNEDRRITFTGLSNNINMTSYSSDPNSYGNMSPQNGLITTNTIGTNYSDLWGKKIKVTGSYVYSNNKNVGVVNRVREYVTTDESNQYYSENSTDRRTNKQHEANLRLDYNIDENNRILYVPTLRARYETENSSFFGETTNAGSLVNEVENIKNGYYQDYDVFNRLFYSHKFSKPGRTISWRSNFHKGWNIDDSDRKARNTYYEGSGDRSEILNQNITRERTGLGWGTGVSYTEPLGKKSQMEIEYEIENRNNDSDKLTFNVDGGDFEYGNHSLDTALSNTFISDYLTQQAELGYQYQSTKFKLQAEVEYQNASLDNKQEFPQPFELNRNFSSVMPTVRMEYKISQNTNIQFDYDTQTQEPDISQLQSVVDNSNPLQLRTGNPELDQSYNNQFRFRFRSNNPDTNKSWFLFARSNWTNNYISNSVFIADEPTEIQDGIILEKGSQLNKPVNLNGYWDFNSWFNYGMPFGFIKSNFGYYAGVNITQRPSQVNDEFGFNNSNRFFSGFSINSNISEQVDFNFNSRSSYNNVVNTLNSNLNNNYFQQVFSVNFNWIIWEGIIYRLDLSHQINTGLSAGFENNFSLVNMSLGKKIFKNERGELGLMVYDLLGQNASVRRVVTETYVEDVKNNVLQRFVGLSFSYNLRRFSKGMDEDKYKEMYQNN